MNERSSVMYFDPKFQSNALVVHPGDFYTTSDPSVMIVTILGSCVAACIRDPEIKIGGLNHFMLPSAPDLVEINSKSNRYGSFAMEKLINEILKKGGKRENLEVKLFGGANILDNSLHIGASNVDFIYQYLKMEGIKIASEDLGGENARRIHFWPASGRVMRLKISKEDKKVVELDTKYKKTVENKTFGDIELF
jgi:chemotaxis protein CheD